MNVQKNTLVCPVDTSLFGNNVSYKRLALGCVADSYPHVQADGANEQLHAASKETAAVVADMPIGEFYTLAQLGAQCELQRELLNELVDRKYIYADGPLANMYSSDQLVRLQVACHLIRSFELEASTVAIALQFAQRIERLEKRVNWLKLACLDETSATRQ